MIALKPQDVLVLLKLAVMDGGDRTYPALAGALGLSPSEVHASVRRAQKLGLVDADRRPIRAALLELLIHGVKYVFAVERGGMTRGLPTAHAAPPLAAEIEAGDDPPPVWPDPEGTVRGEELKPLYRSAVKAARNDTKLYQCLALVDAIRGGRARERQLAEKHLRKLLGP
jgi:DNA-binding MarR family transcriptional regulator